MKRPRVFPVFQDLALDGNDVREHVAMADDDALRLGRCAGREDDLCDVVARDGDCRHRAVGAPVEIRELPPYRVAKIGVRRSRHVVTDEHHPCLDERADLR